MAIIHDIFDSIKLILFQKKTTTTNTIDDRSPEEKIFDSALAQNKKRNRRIVASFLSAAYGVYGVSYISRPKYYQAHDLTELVIGSAPYYSAFISLFIGAGLALYTYLEIFTISKLTRDVLNATIPNSVQTLPSNISTSSQNGDDNTASSPVVSTDDTIDKDLRISVNTSIKPDLQFKIALINEDLKTITTRIMDEIERLGKSANVNLIFGSLNTGAAVVFLAIQVLGTTKSDLKNTEDILKYFIPRISLVIFIEIFAFFFLKIYKSNLSEIKYLHNEKTNIEQRILSIKMASLLDDQETAEFVIKELAKTERNFILKKGETTVELEKEKLEDRGNKDLMETFKSLLKVKSGGSKE